MYWLAILLVILGLVYWNGVRKYAILANEPLNGPKPWPYIGNLLDVFKYGGMHKMVLAYFRRYGRVHKMFIGRLPSIVVSDPEIVKQIFVKEFYKFANRPTFIKPNKPFDANLFVAKDARWKRIRTALTPTFSSGKLKQILPLMEASTVTMLNKLDKFSSTGESFDCIRLFSLFALDVIMKAAFGFQTEIQTDPDEDFVQKAREIFKVPLWIRAFSMFPFADFISSRFQINPLRNASYFLGVAQSMIRIRQEKGSSGRRDLLQLMLEAHEDKINGVIKLGDDEMAVQSVIFLVAGFETTGNTLSNTAAYLVDNPEIQDKLIEELDKSRANRGDMPLYDYIHNLEYPDRVISEVLRLAGPAIMLSRKCEEECTIKGVHFPKGINVEVPIYALHRDPETWENPEKFDPDRFSPEAKKKRHPFSYLPFCEGPRHCIGMRFALIEIKIALNAVFERFRFERAPETTSLEHEGAVTMRPKKVILKVRKR